MSLALVLIVYKGIMGGRSPEGDWAARKKMYGEMDAMPFVPAALGEFNVILAYLVGIILIYFIGRMFLMPIRLVFRLIYNGLIGGVMLWLLNYVGAYFSFSVPLNMATALIAGFLGLPGVVLIILYKVFAG